MPVRSVGAANNPYYSNKVQTASFVIGAEAANVKNVAVQLKTNRGADVAERCAAVAWLSSDVNGDTVHATAPDGGVAIGTDGTILVAHTASKVFTILSEADGDIDVNITHAAGAYTCYLNVLLPDGSKVTSGAITFA